MKTKDSFVTRDWCHPRMLVSSVEDPVLDTLVENLLQPKLDDPSAGMALLSELESEKHILEPQHARTAKLGRKGRAKGG